MLDEARVLLHLARGMPRAGSQAQRMQTFYAGQSDYYDVFRERLLRGRGEMIEGLDPAPGAHVVELGGGTGRNLEFFGPRLAQLSRLDVVDICPSLLARARERWKGHDNVHVTEADACTWRPAAQSVDAVYFSYALTMIPDWQIAMVNAVMMLKPGGRLGVVDFALPPPESSISRRFWRTWFGHDGVHLDDRHLSLLQRLLPDHQLRREQVRLPYLPGPRAHYYIFVGTRR
jgi:S-adenosylmethionine-diacylgycerolhomoserine-N-methlytransferase